MLYLTGSAEVLEEESSDMHQNFFCVMWRLFCALSVLCSLLCGYSVCLVFCVLCSAEFGSVAVVTNGVLV